MTVIFNHFNLLDYPKILKNLIFNLPNSTNGHNIVSLSFPISLIDPLIFLAVMKVENSGYFYWENEGKNKSIVALGEFKSFEINNEDKNSYNRFSLCQEFIKSLSLKYNANFFSYFSFLNEQNNSNSFPVAKIFLPYIQLTKTANDYTLTINTYDNVENINLIKHYIQQNFSDKIKLFYDNLPKEKNNLNYHLSENQYGSFTDKVNQGIKSIEAKTLTKIVIAHTLEVKKNQDFNIINSLYNLRKNYPDCYVFAIENKQKENFIGASPERLLSIENNYLISDALAGSASRGKNEQEDLKIAHNLLNSEKEQWEHQVVSDYIFQQLLSMGLNPQKSPLKLLKLSNIQHLWTPIETQIKNSLTPLEIIEKLHPTPAVAGDPVELACQEIQRIEQFDRSLYSAPIGWLDLAGNCEFVVGIRSALIKGNTALLYAGAGIVAGSQPEQELIEIKLKFQALLQTLI